VCCRQRVKRRKSYAERGLAARRARARYRGQPLEQLAAQLNRSQVSQCVQVELKLRHARPRSALSMSRVTCATSNSSSGAIGAGAAPCTAATNACAQPRWPLS